MNIIFIYECIVYCNDLCEYGQLGLPMFILQNIGLSVYNLNDTLFV